MGVKVREKVKGSGVWWIFIDHHGKRKAKKIGRTKSGATAIARKLEAQLTLGDLGFLKQEKDFVPTFSQYVNGWDGPDGYCLGWFQKVARLSLKNSTRVGYQRILNTYLLPVFGSKRLDEITPRSISDFLLALIDRGLRSGTVKNIKNSLSSILRYSCNPEGFIESNPARGIMVPRPEKEKPAREASPFTWEEREHLEGVFWEHFPRFYPLVVCAFRTGLRIGELLALSWDDIDFYNKLISVRRNVVLARVTTPKTKSSVRQVRMTSFLVEVLKKQRQTAKEEKLRKSWEDIPEWVFHNEDGRLVNYGNFIHRVWNKAIEKSGLRRRTPHDMRHTYATLRLSKGDSLAEVSKEMGHGSTDITYRTYYKWLPRESRTNIDELDGNMSFTATIRNLSATRK